jgi:peptide/nickel transport system permease protein
MLGRLLSRTGILVLTALVGSVVVFLLLAILPGDPAQVALGINATPKALAQMREEFGINRPLIVQYFAWMGGVLTGHFGTSYITGADIGSQISQRLSVTAWLIFLGLIAAIIVAIPLGTLSAVLYRRRVGAVLGGVTQFGLAIPSFIAAILLINIFAVRLGLVPSGGWTPPSQDFGAFVSQAILPVLAIGLIQGSLLSRYIRSATLDVLREDYIRTARAKGLSPLRAFLKHGARNAAIPVVTVLGLQMAALLIDTIVIERVFVIPGLGSLLFDAIGRRDLLLVQGVVLLLVVAILVLNYIIDLVYVAIDPRLRRAS